jgi:hypothetical protein
MAKPSKPMLAVTPEGPASDDEASETTTVDGVHPKPQEAEEEKIRLSIDLSPELHFCLSGIAADERMHLKAFALRLLDQSRRRYSSNAILQGCYEQLRSKRRKTG